MYNVNTLQYKIILIFRTQIFESCFRQKYSYHMSTHDKFGSQNEWVPMGPDGSGWVPMGSDGSPNQMLLRMLGNLLKYVLICTT